MWTDLRVQTLTDLWLKGLSASQIAGALGSCTRNAVIGKVHRLGLEKHRGGLDPRHAISRPPRQPKRDTAPRSAPTTRRPPSLTAQPAELPQDSPGLITDLVALTGHVCKWPIGDPKSAAFTFCGHPADGRYCASHEHRSVQRGTALNIARDPFLRKALAGLV